MSTAWMLFDGQEIRRENILGGGGAVPCLSFVEVIPRLNQYSATCQFRVGGGGAVCGTLEA
jgi:hypothetical protein